MEGEDESSDDPRSISNAKPWKRIVVLASGGFMNLFIGLLLCFVMVSATPAVAVPEIAGFSPSSPLEAAGLQIGDRIVSIDGQRMRTTQDVQINLQLSQNEKTVIYQRGSERYAALITPAQDEGTGFYVLGYLSGYAENSAWNTVKYGWYQFVTFFNQITETLVRLVTGRLSVAQLSGPVGIAGVIGGAVGGVVTEGGAGWLFLTYIFILITINLGIFNLIPFPALDGGRIFFVLVEMVRRKQLKTEHEGIVHFIGFALLIGLIIVVTGFDIWRLFPHS